MVEPRREIILSDFQSSPLFISPRDIYCGFPGGSDGKESACNGETWVQSLGWEDPLEKELATHSRPGESHEQRSLEGYSPWDPESDMTEPLTYTQR